MFDHRSFKFRSVLNPDKWGFVYTADAMWNWDGERRMGGQFVASAAAYYETLGDGNVAHTPNMHCGPDQFTDYLVSLAGHLLAHFGENIIWQHAMNMPDIPNGVAIALAKVVAPENSRAYYSIDSGRVKVSERDEKRHDKRWMEVPSWADGTVGSAITLWWHWHNKGGLPSRSMLERYITIKHFSMECRDFAWGKLDAMKADFESVPGDYQAAVQAFEAAFQCVEQGYHAKRTFDCCVHNNSTLKQVAVEQGSLATRLLRKGDSNG